MCDDVALIQVSALVSDQPKKLIIIQTHVQIGR